MNSKKHFISPAKSVPPRQLELNSLEARTLFSAAAIVSQELMEVSSGAVEEEQVSTHRLAPAENNHDATQADVEVEHVSDAVAQTIAPTLRGDLNHNGIVDTDDIDTLNKYITNGLYDAELDLNGDEVVDENDRHVLVRDILHTQYGDANLDGHIDEVDFDQLRSNLFTGASGWANGDFNGDHQVNGADFLIWNHFKFSDTLLARLLAKADNHASETGPALQAAPTTPVGPTPAFVAGAAEQALPSAVATARVPQPVILDEPIESLSDVERPISETGLSSTNVGNLKVDATQNRTAPSIKFAIQSRFESKEEESGTKLVKRLEEFVL